jgi:hypothetical protein
MNDTPDLNEDSLANASREEIMSALFANMVIQQTNMAMMMLGKVAHPQTGERIQDLEAAKMFIDQLEMLEFKTKGNLTKQEEGLMKQALSALHMAFVEAIESAEGEQPGLEQPAPSAPGQAAAPGKIAPEPSRPTPSPAPEAKSEPAAPAPSPSEEESRKRFSKKY